MEPSDATEKTPATTGIDPGTFRIVAQYLNHYATPGSGRESMRGKCLEKHSEVLVSDYVSEYILRGTAMLLMS
jgi:hypothetical protein